MIRQIFIFFIFIISLGSFSFLNAEIGGGFTGGSLFSSSVGSHTLSLNGANFWTSKRSKFSILIPLSLQFANNSVSQNWLNDYLLSGNNLDPQSIDNMLNEIDDGGLSLNTHGNILFFGLSYKWLSVYAGGSVDIYGTIPKSIFQTIFQGIEFNRPIDLSNSAFGMQMFLPVSWTLSGEISDGLFFGVGLKGLFGLAYSSFKSSGDITSYEDRLFGKGSVEHLYNFGDLYFQRDSLLSYSKMGKFEPNINGKGYAIDIGISKKVSENWMVGLSIQNILGKIDWDKNTSHKHSITYDVSLYSNEFEDITDYTDVQQDSLLETFISNDEVLLIDTLRSTIPLRVGLESEYVIKNRFVIFNSISYEGESTVYPTSQFELSGGFKWMLHRRLPITFGIAHNSIWGIKVGGGFGIHLNNYHLDISFSQSGGFKNDAKGISLNLINYLYF